MKNKKSMKKTILLSAITAIAFGSIAVTTSYALFTDSAETNVTVTAGKVDVEVALGALSGTSPSAINADGTIPEDATSDIEPNDDGVLTFANGGTAKVSGNNVIISNIAPGDSVKVPLTFTNNSTIAIKYKGKYSVSGSSKYEVTFNGLDKRKWKLVEAGAALVEEGSDAYVTISLPASAVDQEIEETTFTIGVEAVQGNAETRDILLVEGDTDEARQASFAKLLNELPAVGKSGQYDIELTAGNYYIPANISGETKKLINITGPKDAVVRTVGYNNDKSSYCHQYNTGKTFNFDGLTITGDMSQSGNEFSSLAGMASTLANYTNCTIKGVTFLYTPTTYTNCKFDVSDYQIPSNKPQYCLIQYGATDVTIDSCSFYTFGKALKIYTSATTTMTIKNSYFDAQNSYYSSDGKAVVEVGRDHIADESKVGVGDMTLILDSNTQKGFFKGVIDEKTNEETTGKPVSTNSEFWSDPDRPTTPVYKLGKLKVVLDGTTVCDYAGYTPEA